MANPSRVHYHEHAMISFPDGTDFDGIQCVGGTLLADVIQDGMRVDVVVIGHCPHCEKGEKKWQ